MYDLIRYKTSDGTVEQTTALSTITRLVVPYDVEYVDLTLILEKPLQDLSINYSRAWSAYKVNQFNEDIYIPNPYFQGYFLSGEYGLRISVTTDEAFISFKTYTASRPDLAREGTFISLDNEWFISLKKEESPQAVSDIDDPFTFPTGNIISVDADSNVYANSVNAGIANINTLYVDSAYIKRLKSDSIQTDAITADNANLNNATINNVDINGGTIDVDAISTNSFTSSSITSSTLELDNYVLGEGDNFVQYKNDNTAFIKWDNNGWLIEPGIKNVLQDSDLQNYLPKSPEHYFLSYDSGKGYLFDAPVIFGRFVSTETDLNNEISLIPSGYITDQNTKIIGATFEKYVPFSNGNTLGYSTSEYDGYADEKDKWYYNSSSETLVRSGSKNSYYSGILSSSTVSEYEIEAILNSNDNNSGEIAFIIAAVTSENNIGPYPIINTLSLVRKPRNFYSDNFDFNNQDNPYRLPPFSLVYNYGLLNQRVILGDFFNTYAPAPTTVNSVSDDPDNWVTAGPSKIRVVKTCVYDENNNPLTTTLDISVSDFDNTSSYIYNGALNIAPETSGVLEQFIGKVAYGFAAKDISSVNISDLIIREKELYKNEIIDLLNDRLLYYVTEPELRDPNNEFYNLGTNAGYYEKTFSSIGYNDIFRTNRLLYNENLRKLYYIENKSSVKFPKVIELGSTQKEDNKIYFDAIGSGFNNNNNSITWLKINDEYIYNSNEDAIPTGLILNIFNNIGDLISTTAYNTNNDSTATNDLAFAIQNMGSRQIGIITSWNSYEASINLTLRNIAAKVGLIKLSNLDSSQTQNPYAAIFQKSADFSIGAGIKAFEATGDNKLNSVLAQISGYIENGTFYVYGPENPNGLVSTDNQYMMFVDSNKDVRILQNLYVDSTIYADNAIINNDIIAGNNITAGNTIYADSGYISNNLIVGNTIYADSGQIANNLIVGNNINISNDGFIQNDLTVNRDAYVNNIIHLAEGSDKGINWPSDAYGGSGDTAKIFLQQGPAGSENYELTIQVANDKDSVGSELITDIINLSVPGDSSTTNAKINRQTIWHEGNYFLNVGGYIENLDDLPPADSAAGAQEIFDTWYRFSHYLSSGFPADSTELDVWVYDSINNSILCTKNSTTYIGFVSPETRDNFILEATINSSDTDDDTIALVIGFVTDSAGNEYTLSIGRTQNDGYTEPTQGWGLIYNLEQSDEVVLYEKTTTQTPGWDTSGGVRIGFLKEGPNLTIYSSQNGSTTYDPTLEYSINLDSAGYSIFSGAVQYGFACVSQLNSTWTDINLGTPGASNFVYEFENKKIYLSDFFGGLTEIGNWNKPYEFNKRFFYNPTTGKFMYWSEETGTINIYTKRPVEPVKLATFTTAERDNLSNPENGDMIYNTDLNKFQGYANGTWVNFN